jgi:hypothetical protein
MFRCYPEGDVGWCEIIEATSAFHAAAGYVGEHLGTRAGSRNIVVTPGDAFAREHALEGLRYGWRQDEDEPAYALFVVEPTVTWNASEVEHFRGGTVGTVKTVNTGGVRG